jgi:O-antigen/teichoic acid export membrane protein
LVVVGLFAWLGPVEPDLRMVIFLLGVSIVAMFQAFTLASVIRAHEDMHYYALGSILQNILLLGSIYLVIHRHAGFTGVFVAYAGAYLLTWGFYWVLVRLLYGLPAPAFAWAKWRYFLKESLPLGLGHILRRIGTYAGIFLLQFLSTSTDLGLFSTANRLILALAAMAMTICFPFLPVFSKLVIDQDPRLERGLEMAIKLMIVMAIPLTVCFLVYGPHLVIKLFGAKFAEAGFPLQLLSFSMLFFFPGTVFIHFFTACGKQRFWSISSGAALAVNVLAGLCLIPKWGYLGAAWATLAAEITLFVVGWLLVRRLNVSISMTAVAIRPLLLGALIGGILFFFPGVSLLQIIIHSVTALAIFGVFIVISRAVTPKEVLTFIKGNA